ncbi:tail fiber, partial [Caudovirales GX15bay]
MPSVIELDLVDLRAPSLAEMQSASGELNISSSPVIEMDLMDGIQIEWEIAGLGGPPGPQGPAGTIVVGSTTTGDPGTDAEVTNSGTSEAA